MEKSTIQLAFNQVQELISHFEAGIDHYLSPSYQEAEVRKEYIDKFYTCLGWDVNHDHQKNPFEQEVKIEKAQRQQGALGQKRADYAFFLAPNYKQEQFFVEAKKPSRTLRENKDDYFQTAKYGWNAGTGVSILTDFEEIVIVDCRFKPDFDTILQNQIKYYHYKDFRDYDTFEEFYWIFSREALVAGNLAKYIDKLPKPKGSAKQLKLFGGKYQSIDESFLNYIDEKRFELAKAFYQSNPSLDAYSLTEATQRTIDRIVFIRFLEDKLIETENIMHNIATANHPWAKFVEYSKQLEAKYNGIVFKPLFIDNKNFGGANNDLFRALCSDLDHTNTPYDLNYIPIHILGSIYERFLGKTIEINNNGACSVVSIEVKPEVRKAGGVFYTPKYIVDYIVKNTVGKLTMGLNPLAISKLTFADIACGSGSFLIGVFEYLLDYHNQWYNQNPTVAKKDGCKYNEDLGVWVLSIPQKQQILLNNIYGVDIDLQATEVTQLSLFLKMLEDETTSTANDMMVLFHEKILPNLTNNIKCGNSLIGTDILNTKLDLDLDQERNLNPFDFKMAFPKIFGTSKTREHAPLSPLKTMEHASLSLLKATEHVNATKTAREHAALLQKGFDAIVGNPPYVSLKEFDEISSNYYFNKYKVGKGQADLYSLFIEKAMYLVNNSGYISFIIPDSLNDRSNFTLTREILLKESNIQSILTLNNVFVDANVGSTIFITSKMKNDTIVLMKSKNLNTFIENKIELIKTNTTNLLKNDNNCFLFIDNQSNKILSKIFNSRNELKMSCFLGRGEEIGKNAEFIKTKKIEKSLNFITGNDFGRYFQKEINKFIIEEDIKKDISKLYSDKIIVRQVGKNITATIDFNKCVTPQSVYTIVPDENLNIFLLLGLLNSSLFDFIYQKKFNTKEIFPRILLENLKQLPIPILTPSNQETHDQIVTLVEQMLQAKKQQQTAVTERDKSYLEQKCNNIDTQINDLVYELYGLSEEEIAVVEG